MRQACSSAVSIVGITMTSHAPESQLLRRSFHSSLTHGERQYWLYLPKGYEDVDTKNWPVILFLHGGGERGEDLERG